MYEKPRPHLGEVLKQLAVYKESKIKEGHLMQDHVHMLTSIPPKYTVSQVVGYIKGKSASDIMHRMLRTFKTQLEFEPFFFSIRA